jgi:hypothetical protein
MCDREAEDHRSGHDHVAGAEILGRGFARARSDVACTLALLNAVMPHGRSIICTA